MKKVGQFAKNSGCIDKTIELIKSIFSGEAKMPSMDDINLENAQALAETIKENVDVEQIKEAMDQTNMSKKDLSNAASFVKDVIKNTKKTSSNSIKTDISTAQRVS